MNLRAIINLLWPWREFRRLEAERDKELERLRTVQQTSRHYRATVSGFQTFCQRELPPDIWQAIMRRYLEMWLVGLRDKGDIARIRTEMAAAGFEGVENIDPKRVGKADWNNPEMLAAWESLREKWGLW